MHVAHCVIQLECGRLDRNALAYGVHSFLAQFIDLVIDLVVSYSILNRHHVNNSKAPTECTVEGTTTEMHITRNYVGVICQIRANLYHRHQFYGHDSLNKTNATVYLIDRRGGNDPNNLIPMWMFAFDGRQ